MLENMRELYQTVLVRKENIQRDCRTLPEVRRKGIRIAAQMSMKGDDMADSKAKK